MFSLIFPQEIVALRVLPTLRAMVARRLAERGLREREIAERMGLTQAAVSKYLRNRGRTEPSVAASPAFQRMAEGLAVGLAAETMTPFEAMGEALALLRREEDRGLICSLHERAVPALAGMGCDLCVRPGASELLLEQEVLGDLRVALRALEGDVGFSQLIPNVGSNLARARPGATTVLEVAAVPGRIFEMRGAVRVPSAPEFGASRHVAEVVLAAMRTFPACQAALNVRADAATLAAARGLRWQVVEFDPAYEGRADRIAGALRSRRRAPRALFHRGAFGIEPVMYVLGASARDVVDCASALAKAVASASG